MVDLHLTEQETFHALGEVKVNLPKVAEPKLLGRDGIELQVDLFDSHFSLPPCCPSDCRMAPGADGMAAKNVQWPFQRQ